MSEQTHLLRADPVISAELWQEERDMMLGHLGLAELSCSSWWSVVGNSGWTLDVSNGVTITCRPFGLETLFSDLLLTGFQLETPHTWSLGNLLGKFRHFKVGLIACRSGMHVPPIQGTCTHVRSLNTPSPASNLNSSVINDPLSVFASLERAHVQWGT